jgi:hypothetical protein
MKIVLAAAALLSCATALSSSQRDTVLNYHNTKRARIANGQETSYSTSKAADMTKLKYDTAIEGVMQNYLNQCYYAHNNNRGDQVEAAGTYVYLDSNTYGNGNCGENLYWSSGTDQSDDYYINQALGLWYDEVTKYWYTYRQYTGSSSDYNAGHFTQMIWSETRYIGCAIRKCSGFTLVGCNYVNAGNMIGDYPYTASTYAASGCPSDMPNNNGGLCDGCGSKQIYMCKNKYSNCDTDLAPYCDSASNAWVADYCMVTCNTNGCASLKSETSCNDGT